eukprot:sb/3466174/
MSTLQSQAADAVFQISEEYDGAPVKGYDFSDGIDYNKLLDSYATTGFQATNFGEAVTMVNDMIEARDEEYRGEQYPDLRPARGCTIFLGFTSNMISSGVRETIKFLVKENLVDVLVTTCGAIEEDLMKCIAPHQIGDFELKGSVLRDKGWNRIGNLIVPNQTYISLETFVHPILEDMLAEQKENGTIWSPSKMISLLGQKINHPDSVLYWAWKNNIPVFCPAITDGAIGDAMYFHSYKSPGLIMDLVQDIRLINRTATAAQKSGMLILGGGVIKHHIANANLMRNGADFTVYINTAQPFDGSDAGATPDEAVSWGKIRKDAKTPVKIYAEATLVFPLLVARTFAKKVFKSDA